MAFQDGARGVSCILSVAGIHRDGVLGGIGWGQVEEVGEAVCVGGGHGELQAALSCPGEARREAEEPDPGLREREHTPAGSIWREAPVPFLAWRLRPWLLPTARFASLPSWGCCVHVLFLGLSPFLPRVLAVAFLFSETPSPGSLQG